MRRAVLLVLLAAVAASAHAAAHAAGQPAQFASEERIAARMLHEGDGKRAMTGAPAPAGVPQGSKGQQEGGAKQAGGGGGGGGGGKGNSGPKIAASLSEWTDDTLSNDGWLMMSFVVAWFAAPGVALLLWPYVVDTAVSIADVAKACKPSKAAA